MYSYCDLTLGEFTCARRRYSESVGESGQSLQSRLDAFRAHQQQGGAGDAAVPKPRPVDMPLRTMRHDGVGKVAENAPAEHPADVVRSDTTSKHEEELPQANMAKSIAAKFKEMQSSSASATPPRPDQSAHKPVRFFTMFE